MHNDGRCLKAYLQPISSSVTMPLSTIVNPPMPGKTIFFKTSVPRAVTLIRQSWAASNCACPWSPHNLPTQSRTTMITNLCIFNCFRQLTVFDDHIFYSSPTIPAIALAKTLPQQFNRYRSHSMRWKMLNRFVFYAKQNNHFFPLLVLENENWIFEVKQQHSNLFAAVLPVQWRNVNCQKLWLTKITVCVHRVRYPSKWKICCADVFYLFN